MSKKTAITITDFENIITRDIPLIDVRAPIEFNKGAFLNASNLPLMNDEERHLVGICYKEKGNEEAVKLGHKLVSGKVRQSRIDAWAAHIDKYPDSVIYCFRGGLRSGISQEWILENTGRDIPRLEGGYKAFRNFLLKALEPSWQTAMPVLLGGCTGSGKTRLIKKLENSIDLEGIANHRGSSFGKHVKPQPTQISFENNLAYALVKHKHKEYRYMILEDESANIGRCFIPRPLFEYFRSGYLILLDVPFEERVYITMGEYVTESQARYIEAFGEEHGLAEWYGYISSSINKLQKRLGGDNCKRIMNSFERAYREQLLTKRSDIHEEWIAMLLNEYYDPMYQYQIEKNTRKILFRGGPEEVMAYLEILNKG